MQIANEEFVGVDEGFGARSAGGGEALVVEFDEGGGFVGAASFAFGGHFHCERC